MAGPARFIVFDGIEGCGKTTQIERLRQTLEQRGHRVLALRDPGSTRISESIRAILLDPANDDIAMRCEMLLYMAARAQMMSQLILPALSRGQIVLCDRFVSSTLAYQGGGEGLEAAEICAVADVAVQRRWPDLTVILDLPVEATDARLNRPRDRIEQRPVEYHRRVRENYLDQARRQPERYRVVDARQSVEVVEQAVREAVFSFS